MKIRDVMTKSPTVCVAGTPLTEVAKMMLDCDCGAIPVVADLATRRPLGIITDRDIVVRAVAMGRNPIDLSARDCMSSPAVCCTEDRRVDDCLKLLEDKQIRRMLVVDTDGAVCGIVAQADLAIHGTKRETGDLVRKISQPAEAHA